MKLFSLDMLQLQFTLEALEPISLPSYKGSTFRGGFGEALKTISPRWFAYFFQQDSQKPRPFVLLPPLEEQQTYQAGDLFRCQLTLFGQATQHYAIAQAAIEYLGREMGLGYSRGKFKINNIVETRFNNTLTNPEVISLSLITRLRLKDDNKLLKQPPEFGLLIAKLMGRLKTLQQLYTDTPINDQAYKQILNQAKSIKKTQSNTQWDDWDRYSSRNKQWMKFGGLLGNISYQGDLQPFIPYLQMGEWCHIGGKSSFGLGKYCIKSGKNNETA